jgi:hypothetical protein
MKYALSLDVAAASADLLMTELDNLSITVEGTVWPFNGMMCFMDKISAVAANNLQPTIFVEAGFKIQAVSAGWTLQVITDKGSITLRNFVSATIAQFTKGVLYGVSQFQALALQTIPQIVVLPIPFNKTDNNLRFMNANKVPYFAYENTTPQGLTTVQVYQVEIVPTAMQQNAIEKNVSRQIKAGATQSIVQNK